MASKQSINGDESTMRCRGVVPRLAALFAIGLALIGCASAQVAEPLTAGDIGDEMDFWHTLAQRPVVSNDEAFHAVLLYVDDEDPANDYAGRVAAMKERGLLTGGFDEPANQAVKRGDLAVATCKILDIKGGVVMRILGPSRRYATRELTYRGIFPTSSENQTFTGNQFIALMGRIEDIQRLSGDAEVEVQGLVPNPVAPLGEAVDQ